MTDYLSIIKVILILITFYLIYIILITYYFKKEIIDNWDSYKCKPYIIPIAGLFKKDGDSTPFMKFTIENFKRCNWVKIKSFFSFFIKPLQYIFKIITSILKNFTETLDKLRAQAKAIRLMFKKIVEEIAEKMLNSYSAVQFYIAKMQNILKQQMAIFQILMYFGDSLKMSMESLINGPLIDLVKFFPLYGIAMLVMIVICMLCIGGGPFVKLVTCPICLACFSGDSLCELEHKILKPISQIKIGDTLKNNNIVTSTYEFSTQNRKCDMYRYKDVIVSGSHIIIDDEPIRVEESPLSKKIKYLDDKIYCLNTSKKRIYINNNNKSIQFSDFYESPCILTNFKTNMMVQNCMNGLDNMTLKPTKDTQFHNYEWGVGGHTNIKMETGKMKKIKDISIGERIFKGGEVYGIIKHSVNNIILFQYKSLLASGTQLVLKKNSWHRIYQIKKARYTKSPDPYIYSLVCDNHCMVTNNDVLLKDYFEMNEDHSVFNEIHSMNINAVRRNLYT